MNQNKKIAKIVEYLEHNNKMQQERRMNRYKKLPNLDSFDLLDWFYDYIKVHKQQDQKQKPLNIY